MLSDNSDQENNELENLGVLHKILKILSKRDIKNLPPDFFSNLNVIVESYSKENNINFLLTLFENMSDDEIVAFVFNSGDRRNRPKLFIVNDVEIDLYGNFFRKMVDFILKKNPDLEKLYEKKAIFKLLQDMFIEELKEFFDKEKLYEKFEKKILNAE
ncbi:MAG TPA: hypothetical protein PKY81_14085 [bacterium]|nr:hypothetical protein [bacterium]HPN32076.1 hypothetical protein [bacterium]